MRNIEDGTFEITRSLSPMPSIPAKFDGHGGRGGLSLSSECHGFWRDAALAVPAALFVLYLAFHAKKNLRKLSNGGSYVMIAYYSLLWFAALLNLAWCSLQAWQCASGKEVAWNLLSLFTAVGMLCLEISLVAFLLQENYATGLETLASAFTLSGLIVGVDVLLKAIFVFGFGVPLFIDSNETTHGMKWGLWTIHKLLLAAVYGFILFVHYSKWRDKLPPRAAFYNYVVVMFVTNAVTLFACGLAGIGASFGLWYAYIKLIQSIVNKFT
ncbi:Serine/threonine-protein kinase [Actinidia chinensis var. chinensis]|uniref:Serine/threonine-protein kinase n=1 Tax=Actinidia chinensis var. chinensis TaxID=1590841 RepID=A0A2R6PCL4_ACTCC|nr:Serine/threonine-protein kinase [Actinidia chinensis var. chinensis]